MQNTPDRKHPVRRKGVSRRTGWMLWLGMLAGLLLAACNTQPKEEMIPVSIGGVDHLADHLSIQDFWVNGYRGHQAGQGGSSICCVNLPKQWQLGLTVHVRWGVTNWRDQVASIQERDVPVEQYEEPAKLWVHFLRDGTVRVVSSKYGVPAGIYNHPDNKHPVRDPIPDKDPWHKYPRKKGDTPFKEVPNAMQGVSMNEQVLEFALGERGDDVIKRTSIHIERSQVSTALLYTARNATYHLKHPQHGIDFPVARSVLFYDDAEDTHGIGQVDISLQLPIGPVAEDSTSQEVEAYDRKVYALTQALLDRIDAAGWQRYISPAEPRLRGKVTYPFKEGYLERPTTLSLFGVGLTSDPGYSLSWDDWRHLNESIKWRWLADGMLLELSYTRDFRGSGVQLMDKLDVTLSTAASVTGASHPDAETKDKYAISLLASVQQRAEREAKARAAGLLIDEGYKDPVLAGVPVPPRKERNGFP